MQLSILIEKLKIDTATPDLGFNTAYRVFEKAADQLNEDMSTSYVIAGDTYDNSTILPDPDAHDQELLLLLANYWLQYITVLKTSDAISWKSGDKSVDLSRASLSKENALKIIWNQYLRLAGLTTAKMVTGSQYTSGGNDSDFSSGRSGWVK